MQLYDITFKRMIISAYHSIHDLGTKDIPVRFDAHFSVSFLLEFFFKKIEVVLFLFCNFYRRHCYVFKKMLIFELTSLYAFIILSCMTYS